jgi:ethanolamine utilization protein EutA
MRLQSLQTVSELIMADTVKLMGLDFGTTTSGAVIAGAQLRRTATGRAELHCQEEIFRSELVFTPLLADDRLDLAQVERLLDAWLEAGRAKAEELFGGGALLTGLTAQKENAAALVRLLRRRLGDTLVATADDPCLESWLAFMGSCAELSRQYPEKAILNLDIGGGTTNIALGQDQQVMRTGCLFLGARHVQVIPGTYQIVKLSSYARDLFDHLHIAAGPGADLTRSEVDAVLTFYLTLLEAVCTGQAEPFQSPIVKRLEQVPFQMPAGTRNPASAWSANSVWEPDRCVVTFSGGVGELVYRHLQGAPWPPTTHYGDLGIDLARRIAQSPIWADSLRHYHPRSGGRATVYGLLRHATEVSGATLFLGAPPILPLADLPNLGCLRADSTPSQISDVLTLVRRSSRGGCVQVRLGSHEASVVRRLGQRISQVLQEDAFPAAHPLVLLVQENLGKVLGQYVTRWGALRLRLLVIDEVVLRDAQYVQIGAPRDQVVPVSFYGFLPNGDIA